MTDEKKNPAADAVRDLLERYHTHDVVNALYAQAGPTSTLEAFIDGEHVDRLLSRPRDKEHLRDFILLGMSWNGLSLIDAVDVVADILEGFEEKMGGGDCTTRGYIAHRLCPSDDADDAGPRVHPKIGVHPGDDEETAD